MSNITDKDKIMTRMIIERSGGRISTTKYSILRRIDGNYYSLRILDTDNTEMLKHNRINSTTVLSLGYFSCDGIESSISKFPRDVFVIGTDEGVIKKCKALMLKYQNSKFLKRNK